MRTNLHVTVLVSSQRCLSVSCHWPQNWAPLWVPCRKSGFGPCRTLVAIWAYNSWNRSVRWSSCAISLATRQFIHIPFRKSRKTGVRNRFGSIFSEQKTRLFWFAMLWCPPMDETFKTIHVKIIQTFSINLSSFGQLLLHGSINYPGRHLSAKTKVGSKIKD